MRQWVLFFWRGHCFYSTGLKAQKKAAVNTWLFLDCLATGFSSWQESCVSSMFWLCATTVSATEEGLRLFVGPGGSTALGSHRLPTRWVSLYAGTDISNIDHFIEKQTALTHLKQLWWLNYWFSPINTIFNLQGASLYWPCSCRIEFMVFLCNFLKNFTVIVLFLGQN